MEKQKAELLRRAAQLRVEIEILTDELREIEVALHGAAGIGPNIEIGPELKRSRQDIKYKLPGQKLLKELHRICEKANEFGELGVDPKSEFGQKLAADYWYAVLEFVDFKEEEMPEFDSIPEIFWGRNGLMRDRQRNANIFLDPAVKHFRRPLTNNDE